MAKSRTRLDQLLARLERRHGAPDRESFAGPFEMVLWEIVAYLQPDERRREAFETLRSRVGLTAGAIAKASIGQLEEIARIGGIFGEQRARRLRMAAEIVERDFHGDLAAVLKLPFRQARKRLTKFPMIGEPGAEKILLFTGTHPVLALESNGLRTLARLGYGTEKKSYAATRRSAQEAAQQELVTECGALIRAHLLLRAHGQSICLRNRPLCGQCPLRSDCPSAIVTLSVGSARPVRRPRSAAHRAPQKRR